MGVPKGLHTGVRRQDLGSQGRTRIEFDAEELDDCPKFGMLPLCRRTWKSDLRPGAFGERRRSVNS